MPIIRRERLFAPPFLMRPYSRRGVTAMPDEYICLYEHYKKFAPLDNHEKRKDNSKIPSFSIRFAVASMVLRSPSALLRSAILSKALRGVRQLAGCAFLTS